MYQRKGGCCDTHGAGAAGYHTLLLFPERVALPNPEGRGSGGWGGGGSQVKELRLVSSLLVEIFQCHPKQDTESLS